MAAAKKCIAKPLDPNRSWLLLPHNETVYLGRNTFAYITDKTVGARQMELKADYTRRIVEFSYRGPNKSGFNGFTLQEGKTYSAKHEDILEVYLGKYRYKILFLPEIKQDEKKEMRRRNENFIEILKIRSPDTPDGEWKCLDDSVAVYTTGNINGNRIAAFGWYNTLVTTKSESCRPQDKDDWKMKFEDAREKLVQLHSQGYNIVVFSNGLWTHNDQELTKMDLKEMVVNIIKHIGIPVTVFIAFKSDIYGMPAPGMWYQLLMLNDDIKVEESFIVGNGDREQLFAENIGMKFYSPEEYFLGHDKSDARFISFEPSTVKSFVGRIPVTSHQEVIIMVGREGSGKTHFCINYLVPLGYLHLERDTFPSMDNFLCTIGEKLRGKQSIVIDGVNAGKDIRAPILRLCKELHAPCRCFYMDVSEKHCEHNIQYRNLVDPEYILPELLWKRAAQVTFNEPTLEEGFSEVRNIHFNANFVHKEHERLYKMYLLQ